MDTSLSSSTKESLNEFNIAEAPIEGRYLIEANAGTGKTFSLVSLYLKFLFNGYSASEIIAVTFSRAATRELSIRIRASLEKLLFGSLQKFDKSSTSEETYFLTELESMDESTKANIFINLRDAVIHLEDHPIQTIDSFMTGFLSDYSFELGQFREKELLEDPNPLIDEIYWNFVRTYLSDHLFLNNKEESRYFLHYLLNKENLSSHGQFGESLKNKYLNFLLQPNLILRPELPSIEKNAFIPLNLIKVLGKDLDRLKSFQQLICEYQSEIEKKLASKEFLKHVGSKRQVSTVKKWLEQIMSLDLNKLPINSEPIENFGALIDDTPDEELLSFCCPIDKDKENLWADKFFTEIKSIYTAIIKFNQNLEHNHLVFLHFFIDEMREEIQKKKEELGVFFYSDYTRWISETLKKENATLAGKHRAFLIDEFQDTDPEQYTVFSRIISLKQTQGKPVVAYFIGDPKQSIYRFRQANLATYFMARESLTVFLLTKNYRTHENLLKKVNFFFSNEIESKLSDPRPNSTPFYNNNLVFAPSSADNIVTEKLEQKYSSVVFPPDFYLHRLEASSPSSNDLEKCSREELETYFVNKLVDHLSAIQKEDPLGYSTVLNNTAILVGTNKEVSSIKKLLDARNVPSVLKSDERVYQAKEFLFLKVLLKAVLNPAPKNIAAPYVWLGLTPPEDAYRVFRTYLEIWQKKSFAPFLKEVFDYYAFEAALLKQGKRSHTNFFHLVDMVIFLEKKITTPLALFEKLDNLQFQDLDQFDTELRYEGSGDGVIKIMTIHKSKGLEYDFVHVIYPIKKNSINSQVYYLLNQKDKSVGILNFENLLDSQLLAYKEQAIKEEISESLRQFYVALTRAKLQINLYIGHKFSSEKFKDLRKTLGKTKVTYANPKTPLRLLLNEFSSYDKFSNPLKKQDGVTYNKTRYLPFLVKIKKEDLEPSFKYLDKGLQSVNHSPETYISPVVLKKNSYQTSFTALSSHPHVGSIPIDIEREDLQTNLAQTVDDIIHLRGGVATGNFFHALIEQWNFSTDAKHLQEVFTHLVKKYSYFEKYQIAVLKCLERLKEVELFGQFTFNDFHGKNAKKFNWLNELEFMLTLKKEYSQLKDELYLYLNSTGQSLYPDMPINLKENEKSNNQDNVGVVKGFIDLVVEYEDRYYIVDWKTNTLGNSLADYDADALAQAVKKSHYQLQALIYLVALERHLKSRLSDYDYDTHIGGASYVFLRGISHPETRGVVNLTPAKKEFEEFKKLFC